MSVLAFLFAATVAAQAPAPAPSPPPSPPTSPPAAPSAPATSAPATAAPAAPEAPAATAPAPATTETTAPAAAPAKAESGRPKLLVLDVKAANPEDIDAGKAETLTQFIASRAARFPLDVMSMTDLRDLAELEGQKQTLGCDSSSTSCLSDIAGALGADFVLATRAGKLDAVYVVSLQVFNAGSATTGERASVEAWSLAEASTKMGPVLDDLIARSTGTSPTETKFDASRTSPVGVGDELRLGLQIGGGVALGVGVIATLLGATPAVVYGNKKDGLAARTRNFEGTEAQIEEASVTHQEALDAKDLYNDVGRWGVAAGVTLLILGGGALAAGFFLPAAEGSAP